MKRFYLKLVAVIAMLSVAFGAKAQSWPANYDGVMLQGFYWDSYQSGKSYGQTRWTDLTNMADELSKYFDLIWVPNSAKSTGGQGYMPVYWFTNHNSAFGSESELKTMISTFAAKGTGIIEDCVINHRCGYSNWYNFPTETWNGKTYSMVNGSICSTDECFNKDAAAANVPAIYKGNPDEGDNFDGARDLDHTNATVQDHCKDYVKFLTSSTANNGLGYAGLRYDMVKGYSGYYTGMYNANAGVKFSVGEYWDQSYDKVAAWINQTAEYGNGKGKSAAFDFPCKYQINQALNGADEDCTKLVWMANNTTPQPAGMIHFEYQQFAVTFVDNHDTFENYDRFNNDYHVMAANAFILFSPGTPCIFWPHYYANKSAMQKLIAARKAVGIHNMSSVKVLKNETHLYVAEITGTKGKAIVKIGSGSYTPGNGYTQVASGNGYVVWTTNNGGITPEPDPDPIPGTYPETLYMMGHVDGAGWASNKGTAAKGKDGVYTYDVTIDNGEDGYGFFAFATVLGPDWDGAGNVNSGNRYGAATKDQAIADGETQDVTLYEVDVNASDCKSWKIAAGKYKVTVDLSKMKITIGDTPVVDPNPGKYPETVYMMGHVDGAGWASDKGTAAKGNNGVYTYNVTIDNGENSYGFFAFATVLGPDWDGAGNVNSGNRYGAATKDQAIADGDTQDVTLYEVDVNASDCKSWKIAAGNYKVTLDLVNMKIIIGDTPVVDPNPGKYPETLYLIGHVNGFDFKPHKGVEAKGVNGVYNYSVEVNDADKGYGYFSFATVLGTHENDWDNGLNMSDRYGAENDNELVEVGSSKPISLYAANVNASGAKSWKIAAGKYDLTANLANNTLTINNTSGVSAIESDENMPAVYYNLQGVQVTNPTNGVYIKVQGGKATKVLVK